MIFPNDYWSVSEFASSLASDQVNSNEKNQEHENAFAEIMFDGLTPLAENIMTKFDDFFQSPVQEIRERAANLLKYSLIMAYLQGARDADQSFSTAEIRSN